MSIALDFKKHQEQFALVSAQKFVETHTSLSIPDLLELSEELKNCGIDFSKMMLPIELTKTKLIEGYNDYSVSTKVTEEFILNYITQCPNFECKEICSKYFEVYGSGMTTYELGSSPTGQQRYKSRIGRLVKQLKSEGKINNKKVRGLYEATICL